MINRPDLASSGRIAILSIVAAVAIFVAGWMLVDYWHSADLLWRGVHHDRNSHLAFGVRIATQLRSFQLIGVAGDMLRADVWPPLHGFVLGLVLAIGDVDPRLAITPSLLGWSTTVFFAALIAYRLSGAAAAAICCLFTAGSPAFRLLGSDVMLEGLGAGLSAAGIYFFLRAKEQPSRVDRWRVLALALTLLFFEKYNYWALLVASLVVATFFEHSHAIRQTFAELLSGWNPSALLMRMLRDPLVIAAYCVGVVVLFSLLFKPAPFRVLNQSVSIYPPRILATVAYALAFSSLLVFWWKDRGLIGQRLGPVATTLLRWHLVPIAVSFLWPRRLAGFLWFLSPSNSQGTHSDPLGALLFQWPAFAEGFHIRLASAVIALTLGILGGIRALRLSPGSSSLPLFVLICASAVLIHPQQQWRFQATWLFALWICSGIGAGILLRGLGKRFTPAVQTSGAATAVGVLVFWHLSQEISPMAARAAIRPVKGPSDLELARAFLPQIPGTQPVAFITSFGRTSFPYWVVQTDCRCPRRVEAPFNGRTRDEMRAKTLEWLSSTEASRVVVIDAGEHYQIPHLGITRDILGTALDMMEEQSQFTKVDRIPVPAFDAVVTIWERRN